MGLFDVAQKYSSNEETICAECGVEFASAVVAKRRNDGQTLFCPNGHRLTFGKTESDRLREENATLRRNIEWQKSQRETAKKRLSAQKGLTTKANKKLERVHAGVCPECNRSFKQLAAHMHTQHPEIHL